MKKFDKLFNIKRDARGEFIPYYRWKWGYSGIDVAKAAAGAGIVCIAGVLALIDYAFIILIFVGAVIAGLLKSA